MIASIIIYMQLINIYLITWSIAYFIGSCHRTVPSTIWEIFSEFLIFCNLFQEPLGEWNNSKIWETRKIFANIARGNVC